VLMLLLHGLLCLIGVSARLRARHKALMMTSTCLLGHKKAAQHTHGMMWASRH
jgi:hypothetical protein